MQRIGKQGRFASLRCSQEGFESLNGCFPNTRPAGVGRYVDISIATPMRITKLCALLVRLTAPVPMPLGIEGRRDLRIVTAFAGTALASLAP